MKALTIRQPWAWAIARGFKDVELRTQLFSHRGPLAIHAGLQLGDADAFRFVEETAPEPMPMLGAPSGRPEAVLGAVIAVVNLSGGHFHSDCNGACSPWVLPGYRGHHMLTDPVTLKVPVLAHGKQGLWSLDDIAEAQVRRQIP